jgi:hypothetical protein
LRWRQRGIGKSSKSDDDGVKEGVNGGGKSNGNGNEEGKGKGGKSNGNGNKGVRQGMAMAMKRAMVTATSVMGDKESAGDRDCNCDSNEGGRLQKGQW